MHCTVTISFAPKTLSDVTDYVTVQSDLTSFHVALFARRDPPVLSLPAVLDCGACLVDHTSVLKFPFRNSGGPGAFRLSFLPEGTETADGVQQWRRAEEREAGRNENGTEADGGTGNGDAETACGDTSARLKNEIASMSNTRSVLGVNGPEDGQNVLEGDPTSVQWGPFTLSPASFRLGQSESGTITVTFNPHSEDRFSETLQLSCDNCRSQTLEVVGRGAILDVQVAEIDGRGVGEGELQQGVWFEATPPGAPLHRTVTVENRTALDVPVRCELAPVLNELGEMRLTYADVSAITGAGLSQAAESILGERVVGRRRSGDSPGETAAERNAPVFTVEPAEIVIGADSRAEFVLTFAPDRVDLLQSTARFEVDTRRVNYPGGANFGVTLSSFGEGQGQDSISSSFPSALRSPLSRSGTEGRSGRLERLASKKDRTAASYADVSADNGGGPVTSSELVLGGVGAFIAVALTPEVVAFPGEILIGQAYRQMVTLSNRSAAAARFSWAESGRPNAESGHGEGGILAERGPGFGEFGINARSSTVASGGAFFRPSLSFSPQEGTVPPFEDLSVEVEVTARQLGPFDAGFECRVDNFYGGPLRLRARGRAVAPAVRFDQAAADFGLVERGHVAQVEVVVRNDSDVPASWAVEQVAEAEMEAGISSQEQLTRQQSIRQLEVSAAGRTEPETEPTAVLGTETKATPAASGAGSEFEEESTAAERADTGSLEPTADTSVSGGTKPETSGRAEGSWGPSSSFCRSLGLERTTSSRSTFGDTFSPHVLEISPSSGFLGAHSSARLLVSFSPAHCQPLQTVLELHTGPVVEEDPSSGSGVLLLSGSGTEVKHILATATVVAPRVVLDQSELDLGTCFVNMPLERNLVLLNLSAIPADFAWAPESIGDPSESLEVSVAPKSGRIPAKGRQEVLVRISPVREPAGGADCGLPSGKLGSSVEKILTCDVLGADIPLALRISAKVQGLRFSFEVLGGATLRPGPHRTRSPLTDTGVATERDTELRESEGTGRQTEDGGTSQREEARLSGAESPDGSNGTDAQQIPPAVTESSGADSAAEPSGTAEGDSLDPLSETESTDQPALETGHPSAESKEELSVAEDRPGTSQLEPLASVPARLDFGFGLSIGERKTLTLVVKNHSGVRAPVSVRLLHMGSAISSGTLLFSGLLSPGSKSVHSAGGMTSGKSSLGSGFWPLDVSKSRSTVSGDLGQSTGKRKGQKALLGTAHETARNFNSSLGQTVLTKRQVSVLSDQVLTGPQSSLAGKVARYSTLRLHITYQHWQASDSSFDHRDKFPNINPTRSLLKLWSIRMR